MSRSALSPGPLTRAALDLSRHWVALVATGLGALVLAWLAPSPIVTITLLVVGLTFGALLGLSRLLIWRFRVGRRAVFDTLHALVEEDVSATVTTDIDGAIDYANRAARNRFEARAGAALAGILGDVVAQPASFIYRLQNRALATGSAREDVVNRGERVQVSAHRIGRESFLWRFDELGEWRATGHSGDHIGLPMMTVARSGTILFMNEALRSFLGGRETALDRVFVEMPVVAGRTQTVRGAQGPARVQVVEVPLSAGRREIYLLPEPDNPEVSTREWGIVENMPVALLKLDARGAIAMSNQRARALLGTQDANGALFSDLVEGLGRPVNDWLDDVRVGRGLGRTETVHATRRKEDAFVQVSLERVRDDDGEWLIAVLSDATELKTLEMQGVQSQKMEAIGQLAGGVAHDFNNVLTAISGHCDFLLMRHQQDDQDYADLIQISQNANRAAALVGQLLAFSRKQHLRPDIIDLSESMSELSHLLGRLVGEKVVLDYQHDHEIRPIRADKRKLEQVIMNLVVNARDAMAEGGRVRLDVRNVYLDTPLDRDRVRVPAGDYVTIRVIDEGTGIPGDKIGRIFEPFFSTKGSKGTGLGLSMAYGIVKQTGGYIFVDSVVGSGTTFTLYFPVHRTSDAPAATRHSDGPDRAPVTVPEAERVLEAVPSEASTPPAPDLPRPTHELAPPQGGTVLLVEDEAPVRAFASRALRMRGYTVIEAEHAEEALERLADPAVEVDVVVTDVVMPGMDGPTWVAEALKDRPGIKVVFVSGYSGDSVSEHQKRIPNSVFLPKPFSLSELTATVSAQIH